MFETAWNVVPDFMVKMSLQFPDVKIVYKYSDEDTGNNCGIGEFHNNEILFQTLKNGSDEAYELAFELRPNLKECFKRINGKYEWVEDE
jgi:hypothetical protein